ncbi:MAG: SDR family oxidoreductase [Candidatus Bathyarchaeia archaeon]
MAKILVTGARGFVGSNFYESAKRRYDVVATSLHPQESEGIMKLDITSREEALECIRGHSPDLVVHSAACLDFGVADEEMWRINVDGTRNIVDACKAVGVEVAYISTDWVFNGSKQPGEKYREDEKPAPLNPYGLTKLEGERIIRNSGIPHIIARPANIYGVNPIRGNRDGFAVSILRTLRRGEVVKQPDEVWQTPTLVDHLAERVLSLYAKGKRGIFHTAGADAVNRYEFFRLLAGTFSLNGELVKPSSLEDFGNSLGARKRLNYPKNASLAVGKVEEALGRRQLSLAEGLRAMKAKVEQLQLELSLEG